MVMDLMVVSER